MHRSAISLPAESGLSFSAEMSKPLLRPVMPELHSLRGIACLAVLFFHGLSVYIPETATGAAGILRDLTSGGHYGVNLFFVLSGLLITNILLNERERPDYFPRFYKRRVLRILPPFYMMIILLAMYGLSPRFLGLSMLHIANLAPILGVPLAYGPFWSLAVEEQFYLLWPTLARKIPLRALIFLLLAVIAGNLRLAFQPEPHLWASMTLWYSSHGLALGALLTIFLRSIYATRRNAGMMAAALALSGGLLRLIPNDVTQSMACELVFGALLLGALLFATSRFERWTRPRILLFFGEISYGLYLVHILVFALYRHVVLGG